MSSFLPRLLSAAAAFVVVTAGGCATLQMDVPDRFLVIKEEGDSLKAMTPEESRLWVRDFNDDTRGSLTFWRDALRGDLLKGRGYTPGWFSNTIRVAEFVADKEAFDAEVAGIRTALSTLKG